MFLLYTVEDWKLSKTNRTKKESKMVICTKYDLNQYQY